MQAGSGGASHRPRGGDRAGLCEEMSLTRPREREEPSPGSAVLGRSPSPGAGCAEAPPGQAGAKVGKLGTSLGDPCPGTHASAVAKVNIAADEPRSPV